MSTLDCSKCMCTKSTWVPNCSSGPQWTQTLHLLYIILHGCLVSSYTAPHILSWKEEHIMVSVCFCMFLYGFYLFKSHSRQPWSHNTSSSSTGVKTSKSARGTGFKLTFSLFWLAIPYPLISRKFSLFKPYFFPPNNYHFPLVDHPAGSFEILRIFWQWISWITPSSVLGFWSHIRIWYIFLRGIFSK